MSDYGKGIASASVAATETTAPVASTSAGVYDWGSDGHQNKVVVFNHFSNSANVYVRWNDTDVSTVGASGKAWDAVLEPGADVVSPDGIMVEKVAIWIDAAATYGTNYVINGWN